MFVSNTSTLILLAKITLFYKFIENSPKIVIPKEVRKEYLGKESFETALIEKEIEKGNIKVAENPNLRNNLTEQFHLDKGEAEAYNLFKQDKYEALLTDDGELIKLCKLEQIPFICALAIVLRLYEKGAIKKEEALEKMDNLVKVGRYKKEIYEYYKGEVK